jgi:hypothetical protein
MLATRAARSGSVTESADGLTRLSSPVYGAFPPRRAIRPAVSRPVSATPPPSCLQPVSTGFGRRGKPVETGYLTDCRGIQEAVLHKPVVNDWPNSPSGKTAKAVSKSRPDCHAPARSRPAPKASSPEVDKPRRGQAPKGTSPEGDKPRRGGTIPAQGSALGTICRHVYPAPKGRNSRWNAFAARGVAVLGNCGRHSW